MAVRSRSSLRVSERRDPQPVQTQPRQTVSLDENGDARPPPSKRPRLHPPRGRRSSSDHLDATIDHPLTPSSRPSPAKIVKQQTLRRYFHQKPQQNHTSSIPPLHLDGGSESPDPLHTDPPANAPSPAPASTSTPTSSARPQPEPAESHPTTASPSAATPSTTPSKDLSAKSAVPEQRRSLRSHDGGARPRSELALYFPNYEQLLSFETPKTDLLNPHTSIKVIDDLSEPPILSDESADALPFGNPLAELHECETITLALSPEEQTKEPSKEAALEPTEQTNTGNEEPEDPLDDAVYFRAHRRHERQEKQLRNIERERAQHEKQQLDRLLDELRSHEWLRVMGITGHVTDAEKRHYESKRDLFVSELSALIQKFKIWKQEEKRRKLEREQKPRTAANHADADAIPQSSPKGGASDDLDNDHGNDKVAPTPTVSDAPSYTEPLDPNDVDACAARQLHQEAARSATTAPASSRGRAPKSSRRKTSPVPVSSSSQPRKETPKAQPPPPPPPPSSPPPDPNRPFTSFFSKPHLREAALSLHRTGGRRTRLAFGQPLPEMEMGEFELPAEILTPEAIDSCRRERRRRKRANRG
ncbi:acetyltransferase SAS4-like domain-containing protein [Aspergillus candidus]|uniref:Something about silencing, SAS, complex subunit 4-domain-containing protein n=1 Tax=Aspergillus candidus TaxID=41067 RepID=A0A2I2F177_ASPCN|nr:something about silencing, SAS, complex subunit 4-domain-containing protein [Aspergillus candidus]PLB34385.1 something about silencing, SAS, complex subunit 4-domain-containing protein [Aspergillus candidus]